MAVLFDRANAEHLEDDDATHLEVGTSSFTLMTWAKWTDGTVNMYLVGKGNPSSGGIRYQLVAKPAGDFVTAEVDDDIGIGRVFIDTTTTGMNDGVLRHIAMVVNKSDDTLKIYVDGVEEASAGIVGLGTLTSNIDFKVGSQGTADVIPFSGTQEDVRLYLRALSSDELRTIHAVRGHDGIVLGLEGRWTMNELEPGADVTEAPPNIVIDVSGNGNDMEGHGDTTFLPEYAPSELSIRKRAL